MVLKIVPFNCHIRRMYVASVCRRPESNYEPEPTNPQRLPF